MMEIKHRLIEKKIQFDFETVYYLCIENIQFYRRLTYLCSNGIGNEDTFMLFNNDEQLQADKTIFFIDNPLKIDFDEKKLNLTIQKDVANSIDVTENENFLILLNQISEYIESISYDYPLNISYDSEMTLPAFLKAFSLGYSVKTDDYLTTLVEKIKILSSVFKYKVFILLNLCDYLTEEEFLSFVEEMRKLEVYFFVLSSHLPIYKIDEEFIIRIDNDLCELHIDSKSEKC